VATRAALPRKIVRLLLLIFTWSRDGGDYGSEVIFVESVVERGKVLLDELVIVRDRSGKFSFYRLKQF
jgi:hypothetical protein